MKLAYARIVTEDVPALARFYGQITGIAPVGNDDYVEFRTAGSTLALSSQRAVERYCPGSTVARSNRSAIVEFQVADVDSERARLDPIVREWVLQPTTQPWGNRSMLFRDPDGNLINFFTPVLGAAGA